MESEVNHESKESKPRQTSGALPKDRSEARENSRRLAREVKALVVLAFRNGPIEDVHAAGRITEEEMKRINKQAVNQLYRLLRLCEQDCEEYARQLNFGELCTKHWDDPDEERRCPDTPIQFKPL